MDTDRAVRKTRRARRALGFERRFDRDARVVDRDATRGSIAFPDETPMKRTRIEKTAYEKVIGCVSDWERTQLDTSPASNQETGVFRERIYAKRSAYQISSISTDSALGRSKIRFREIPDSSPVR